MPTETLCVTQDGIDSDNIAAMNLIAKSTVYNLITTKDLKIIIILEVSTAEVNYSYPEWKYPRQMMGTDSSRPFLGNDFKLTPQERNDIFTDTKLQQKFDTYLLYSQLIHQLKDFIENGRVKIHVICEDITKQLLWNGIVPRTHIAYNPDKVLSLEQYKKEIERIDGWVEYQKNPETDKLEYHHHL